MIVDERTRTALRTRGSPESSGSAPIRRSPTSQSGTPFMTGGSAAPVDRAGAQHVGAERAPEHVLGRP